MAKNLKLSIKNTQLAEALKLNQLKKPARKKKEEEATASPSSQPPQAPSPAPEAKTEAPVSKKPVEPVEPVESPVEQLPPPPPQAAAPHRPSAKEKEVEDEEEEAPPPARPPVQQRPPYTPPVRRPYEQGGSQQQPRYERPSYPPRDRPPGQSYPPRDRPPGSYSPRPPGQHSYPPRDRPPGQSYGPPGQRPPYSPPGQRPYGPPGSRPAYGPPGSRPSYGPPGQRPYGPPRPPMQRPPIAPPDVPKKGEPTRKAPSFREYRDVKPSKKQENDRGFDARDRKGLRDLDDEQWRKKRATKMRGIVDEEIPVRPKQLKVRLPITVKDLAVEMKLKASQLIAKLLMHGNVVTLNDYLDDETVVQVLGQEFDCVITIDTSEETRLRISDKTIRQEILETDPSLLLLRPPVVTFMGHVDHGKTSLIDSIRKTNRASTEAGEITQHIGAFKCHTAVGDLTILDTPGHEAFSAMRTRGAEVTDIVVLVIAGDEGMRTQTIEAMQQAKEAKVPIVVAINKSDKPNFNAETVYRQLADHELLPEAWGGTTITVNCSATTGTGIKELLEMLALQAEVLELKANPEARARGSVIESEMHKGLGSVATILVQNGTLHLGDSLVFPEHWGRVKTMHNEYGKQLQDAGPSTPVKITGLSGLPKAGNEFFVVKNEKEARELSEKRNEGQKRTLLQQTKKTSMESLMQQKTESKKILNILLKADVQGSLEALKNSLLQITSKKIELNILAADVGEISESDVQLAAASKAVIVGFHTKVESHAEGLIKQLKVIVKTHDIIYHAVDDVKEIMLSLLDKLAKEIDVGTAEVKTTFKASQLGVIAGCTVTDGIIKRSCSIRVIRDKQVVWRGPIASLKRVKEDVREVSKGYECGILLNNFNDVKEGDILEAYEITYLTQEL